MTNQAPDNISVRNLTATTVPSTARDEDQSIEVVMSTERAAPTYHQAYGFINEILDHSPGSVRLSRFQSGAPLIDNHNRFGSVVDNTLGVVDSVRLENGRMVGRVRFSKNKERATTAYKDTRDGITRNFSIGYVVHKYEKVSEDDGGRVTLRAVDWEPMELSQAIVPADASAQARNFNNSDQPKMEMDQNQMGADATQNRSEGGTPDTTTTQTAATAAPATGVQANTEHATTEVVDSTPAERNRAASIVEQVRMAGLDFSVATELITRGLSATEATAEITKRWAQNQPPVNNGASRVTADNEREVLHRSIEDAILLRAGVKLDTVEGKARDFAGMSMRRLAEAYLRARGENTASMSDRAVIDAAFGVRSGLHSTSDFPILLGNAINRSLRAAYQLAPRTFLEFTRRGSFSDFRPKTVAQVSGMVGNLDEVLEGGEYKRGTMTEAAESYALRTFGKVIGYTRQMAANDDLDAFFRIPQAMAAKAAQLQSNLVYNILTSNPLMADGNALFSAPHGNLATVAGAPSEATLAAALQAMRLQKDLSGDFINLTMSYMIVGPQHEVAARKLLTAVTADQTGNVNIFANSYRLIVEPRLGAAWFLSADPGMVDTIEYGFLDGEELYTETRTGFDVDGTEVKIRMDFNAKAIDHVGLYKNAGA